MLAFKVRIETKLCISFFYWSLNISQKINMNLNTFGETAVQIVDQSMDWECRLITTSINTARQYKYNDHLCGFQFMPLLNKTFVYCKYFVVFIIWEVLNKNNNFTKIPKVDYPLVLSRTSNALKPIQRFTCPCLERGFQTQADFNGDRLKVSVIIHVRYICIFIFPRMNSPLRS